jgi:hypothetical protein
MCERADRMVPDHAWMIDNLLKLDPGGGALPGGQIICAAASSSQVVTNFQMPRGGTGINALPGKLFAQVNGPAIWSVGTDERQVDSLPSVFGK